MSPLSPLACSVPFPLTLLSRPRQIDSLFAIPKAAEGKGSCAWLSDGIEGYIDPKLAENSKSGTMAAIVIAVVPIFVGVALAVEANSCPIVSESFTGTHLLDAIDNSKCIYHFGKLVAGDDGSVVNQNRPCRSIVTPIRTYTLDDHKCEEDPSPNFIEFFDKLLEIEAGFRGTWLRITGTTRYDLESAYTFQRHDDVGADCELKGATDMLATYSMEFRQCPDFWVLVGATLGIAAYVQAFTVIIVLLTFTRCGWAEKIGQTVAVTRHHHEPAEL